VRRYAITIDTISNRNPVLDAPIKAVSAPWDCSNTPHTARMMENHMVLDLSMITQAEQATQLPKESQPDQEHHAVLDDMLPNQLFVCCS